MVKVVKVAALPPGVAEELRDLGALGDLQSRVSVYPRAGTLAAIIEVEANSVPRRLRAGSLPLWLALHALENWLGLDLMGVYAEISRLAPYALSFVNLEQDIPAKHRGTKPLLTLASNLRYESVFRAVERALGSEDPSLPQVASLATSLLVAGTSLPPKTPWLYPPSFRLVAEPEEARKCSDNTPVSARTVTVILEVSWGEEPVSYRVKEGVDYAGIHLSRRVVGVSCRGGRRELEVEYRLVKGGEWRW